MLQGVDHGGGIRILGQEGRSAGSHGLFSGSVVVGEYHDRKPGELDLQAPQRCDSAAVRKGEVEHDSIKFASRCAGIDLGQRRGFGGDHNGLVRGQGGLQALSDNRVIIGDQNSEHRLG